MNKSPTIQIILFFLLIILINRKFALSQPFNIRHLQITFIDENRNNRHIKTDIYYPEENTLFTDTTAGFYANKFPVIVFGHGFLMAGKFYKNIWKALVPEGYIFAIPKKEGGIAPSHLELAVDLVFLVNQLEALNSDTSSFFFNKILSRKAVMGHSMGGGSAVLAAQNKNSVDALVNFAAFETTPSAIVAAENVSIPALIFSGQNDCVTPPDIHQIPIYNAMKNSNKTYIEIIGGSHCRMAQKNKLCNLGEKTCEPKPGITYKKQHEIINRYLIPWLDFIMKDDQEAAKSFDNKIITDPDITYMRTISLIEYSE